MTPEEPQASLAMLGHPERWPIRGVLPVKQWRDGQLALGLVLATPEPLPVVVRANLYDPGYEDAPRVSYPDFAALVDDGWRVD
jgi:hypothetical protein